MENRMEILDLEIDTLTAKEILKRIVQFMEYETVSTVEIVSLELLMQGQENLQWKEQLREMDLILPGEREILEASNVGKDGSYTGESLEKELEDRLFLKMFLKYLRRSRRSIFLLAGQEGDLLSLRERLSLYDRNLLINGQAVLEPGSGREEQVINEINGVEPDCIISVLPCPEQENFISNARALLNARVWFGCGSVLLQEERKKKTGKLQKFILKRVFRHLMGQQKEGQEEGDKEGL